MRALTATLLVLCAACGPRHDEDLDFEVQRPDRIAADPSIGGGNRLPPPPPPPPPPGSTSVSDVRTFAEATPGIYEMELDETHLYWVTDGIFGPSQVWRANRENAAMELLATSAGRVYALAIDEAHVYFVETFETAFVGGGSVLRVPKSGGGVQTVVAGLDNPTSVAVDDTHVYFTRAFSPDGEVQRAPKTGGQAEVLLADVDNPWDIAVDATHLYVSEMNRSQILRAPKTGGEREVLASGWLSTGWMAVGPAGVYFATCSVGTCAPAMLRSVPLAGGDVTLLHESSYDVTKVAFGGDYVLWGRWFVPLDGSAVTELLGAIAEEIATVGVAGDDRAVFFADHPSGKIFTATVSGE
jgi:hypothetical protein